MKKIIFALLAFVAIAGCEQSTAPDGYRFEPSQPISREIKVIKYPSYAAIKTEYARMVRKPLPANRDLQAFSVIDNKVCTIHMIDPAVKYSPEFFGHELTHCLYGEFHPSQNG